MSASWRRRSRFQSKKFRPYALAIGQMNLAWNDLHEEIGLLFQKMMLDSPTHVSAPGRLRMAWGIISSDRQKRLLVEKLADWMSQERREQLPALAEDLKFLTKRAQSLEDKRNDVIHAPIDVQRNALVSMGLSGGRYGEIYAAALNTRGRSLAGPTRRTDHQLLAVIRLYRDYATALAEYAKAIRYAWIAREAGRRRAWPRRPPVPQLRD
jgi:hypothetical protein